MLFDKKKIITLAVIVVIVNLALYIYFGIIISKSAESNNDSYVYVICDVYDVTYNGDNVEIEVILPNGNLLTRMMHIDDDLPEDFNEVVIQTSNLDDYATYKIVGMR